MDRRSLLMAAGALALTGRAARAVDEVVIGCVYPLTGNGAAVGLDARVALETAADIVNGTHAPIDMLMGKGGGLDKLGGAKIRLVFADSQNDPQKARAEAERIITQEKAVTIIGSYTSATGATISQVTER
jgi:branched-chain amino acid transport system substrate-binding protein